MEARLHRHPEADRAAFRKIGIPTQGFFPHHWRAMPKCGPDGMMLAERMANVRRPDRVWQLVLFAEPEVASRFDPSLFHDADVAWHQQHFGRLGQVASVSIAQAGRTLYTMCHQSDLVQRISRRRELKTRVEREFRGWHHLLMNAVANFAHERKAARIRIPSAELAMLHTDRARVVKPALFQRVYDGAASARFDASRRGDWWEVKASGIASRRVPASRHSERIGGGRTVCVMHDIEGGFGHRDGDPAGAARMDLESPRALREMLAVEADSRVSSTYCVVGALFPAYRESIEQAGHCLAFHSFDHDLAAPQLGRCRSVDYRVKGYRVPRSRVTRELSSRNLAWHNFEWVASSVGSLGTRVPRLQDGVARIPVLMDDYALHTREMEFEPWLRLLLDAVERHEFVALGLHDCYAAHWLPHYPAILSALQSRATLRTADSVAADLFLANAT
ncbi:MAG: hypothetical protein JWO05_1336 [Gemmatimonadetes bacterium]|nr:hypothetical protein [Gemmatimonadota bacterium]